VLIELISAPTSSGGLRVAAAVDTNPYPTKLSVSDAELAALHLVRDPSHPHWHYTLHPQ
jgi:hypothetical protein